MELKIIKADDKILHIALTGRLDLQGTQQVEVEFTSLLSKSRTNILVDVSGLDFLASMGMRMLLSCAKSLKQTGSKIILAGPKASVEQSLRTAGLDGVLYISGNMEEALKFF